MAFPGPGYKSPRKKEDLKKPKARIFRCKKCNLEFYVPHTLYTVHCSCGVTGYSEEIEEEIG